MHSPETGRHHYVRELGYLSNGHDRTPPRQCGKSAQQDWIETHDEHRVRRFVGPSKTMEQMAYGAQPPQPPTEARGSPVP